MKTWRKTILAKESISKFAKGGYRVSLKDRTPVTRNNKTAAGMQRTSDRHKLGRYSHEALELIVFGTLDPLRRGLSSKIKKGCCPTCGTNNAKLVLTASGYLRLRTMRRKAQARLSETESRQTLNSSED